MSRAQHSRPRQVKQWKKEDEAELREQFHDLVDNDAPIGREANDIKDESRQIRGGDRSFILVLFGVIVLSLLLVMMLGVGVYQALVKDSGSSDSMRLSTSLLAANVQMMDTADALHSGSGPEGASLVLTEHTDAGVFETRLYLYQGKVMQEYSAETAPYSPETATALMDSETFSFSIEGNAIALTTDAGSVYVTLRSYQGGE